MMRYGLDAEAAGRYAAEIVQAVKTLNPIMIYIDQNDISETAALWHTGTDAASYGFLYSQFGNLRRRS